MTVMFGDVDDSNVQVEEGVTYEEYNGVFQKVTSHMDRPSLMVSDCPCMIHTFIFLFISSCYIWWCYVRSHSDLRVIRFVLCTYLIFYT